MVDVRRSALALLLWSAGGLFLELAIIRLAGGEIVYLGWFANFVLVSAFVGIGLGLLAARGATPIASWLPFLLLFLVAITLHAGFDVGFLRNRFGLYFWGSRGEADAGVRGMLLLPVLFVATAGVFAAHGQRLGQLLGTLPPLRAYAFDIGGSLLGIVIFTTQAATWSHPVAWMLTGGFLLACSLVLCRQLASSRAVVELVAGVVCCCVLLLARAAGGEVTWSPYQKLEYRTPEGQRGIVFANRLPTQILNEAAAADRGWYGLPYSIHTTAGGEVGDVLVIGAGSGTDVAVALRHGARRVDAVEIDPGIAAIGAAHHPDRPFGDPRVAMHVTDGREFLHRTSRRYDLVVFALPDSVALVSPMNGARLESHLFTLEAMREVRARLKPRGTFALYNQYRWDWLRERIGAMLRTAFGRAPRRVDYPDGTTVFAVGSLVRGNVPLPVASLALPTDDWPFLYLREPAIHWLYLGMIAMFLATAIGGVAVLAPRGTLARPALPFFFMGAAFLLLETKSLAFFGLLFGNTWLVNAMAFGGILGSVLAANALVARFRPRRRWPFVVAILAALALAYAVPPSALLDVGYPPLRFGLAVALVFAPVFFANVLFSRELAEKEGTAVALGWNLLGAVVGGGLEYLALLVGFRNLLLIAAACYVLTALTLPRRGFRDERGRP